MSETNQNLCEPGKHHYQRHESIIYCISCGDVKSLVLPVPVPSLPPPPTTDKFETARKFFFELGQFPNKESFKASVMKLFQNVTKDKHILLNDIQWKNIEENAMFIAIIMVTKEGGYFVEVKTKNKSDVIRLQQRVQFHLEYFTKSPELDWSGMRFDVKEQRLEVLMKGAKNTNSLLIYPDPISATATTRKEKEKETPLSRFDKATDYLVKNGDYIWLDSNIHILQEIRSDLIKSHFEEALFGEALENIRLHQPESITASIVACIMVSQLPLSFNVIAEKPSEYFLLVRKFMDIFKDHSEFGWLDIRVNNNAQSLTIRNNKLPQISSLSVSPPKVGVLEIMDKLLDIYEENRNIIASENQRDMDAILNLCQTKLKPGEYLELSEKEYPRLEKDPFMFEHFLRKYGYCLSSKNIGYRFMVTMPLL